MSAPTRARRLLAWMLGRLPLGPYREALCGDLMEEFERRGAGAWMGREVVSAMAAGIRRGSGRYAFPLVFSVAWSLLYPTWRSSGRSFHVAGLMQQGGALAWPYSSLVELANVLLPALLFVWAGLLLYVVLRPSDGSGLNWFRTLLSLSTSLSVLLLSTMCLLLSLKQPAISLTGRGDLFWTAPMVAASVPLALSLMAATLLMLPPRDRLSRGLAAGEPG